MIKRLLSRGLMLVVALTMLVACSSHGEHAEYIPADVQGVVTFDVKSLAKKAGVDGKEKNFLTEQIIGELEDNLAGEDLELAKEIVKDPRKIGLDFSEPVYYYSTEDVVSNALLAEVEDEGDLKAFIELVKKNSGEKYLEETVEGFTVVQREDNYSKEYYAYNSKVFISLDLMYSVEDEKAALTKLLKVQDKGAASTKVFAKMMDEEGDIRYYGHYSALMGHPVAMALGATASEQIKLMDKLSAYGAVRFEDGKTVATITPFSEDAEIEKKLIASTEKLYKETQGTFLEYFAKSSPFFLTFGLDGEELLKTMEESYPEALKELEKENDLKAIPIKELIKSLKGDISLGLVHLNGDKDFDLRLYATLADKEPILAALKAVMHAQGEASEAPERGDEEVNPEWRSTPQLIRTRDGEYLLYTDEGTPVTFLVKDDKLYIGTRPAAEAFTTRGENLTARDLKGLKGEKSFFFLDFHALFEQPLIKAFSENIGEKGMNALNKFKLFTVRVEGTRVVAELEMSDSSTNALKQIIDVFKDLN